MENGKWQTDNRQRSTEDGGWRTENRQRKTENRKRQPCQNTRKHLSKFGFSFPVTSPGMVEHRWI